MATTRFIPLHVNKGRSAAESIKDRLDYAQNPEKTDGGELVTAYACNPNLSWQEFNLMRREYIQNCKRPYRSDVVAYQIRQAFKPGEISPEEANRLGYELAMRFTKGKHAFTVSTHIDRAHVHNHIIFSAVDLTGTRKFRDFYRSGKSIRKLSDIICVEHGMSIIEERPRSEWVRQPKYEKRTSHREILRRDLERILDGKPGTLEAVLRELTAAGYEIKSGKNVSVRGKGMKKFIRLNSLGDGYQERDLLERAAKGGTEYSGVRQDKEGGYEKAPFSLMVDFERVLREKKGPGYEHWALSFNNDQAAEVLIFLQENDIDSFEKLDALADGATENFHALSEKIKQCEKRLSEIAELKKAIVNYSKTRDVYEAYRKAGYSRKFFEEHREEITVHQAAKKLFDELHADRIPRVKELSAEYAEVLAEKKAAYKEYRQVRSNMKNYTIARKNVDMLLGREQAPAEKTPERKR